MHEALAVKRVYRFTRDTMLQSADILMQKYPGEFSGEDFTSHIDDLLYRFQNKFLGDTIFRVGCDLFRKLGPEDRLSGAIRAAIEAGLPYDRILQALVFGMHFRARDEKGELFPQDREFIRLFESGIPKVLTVVCGFNEKEYPKLFREAETLNASLQSARINPEI
jgi:mannitol-1-phosphate 5-dehydrogenase